MLSNKKRVQVKNEVKKRMVKGKEKRKKKEEESPWKNHAGHRTCDRDTSHALWLHDAPDRQVKTLGTVGIACTMDA